VFEHDKRADGLLADGRVHPNVTAQIASVRGRGTALDAGVRADLSGRLGDSFSDVRVHTDSLSAALARSVQARAFTTGSDIFFGSGEYQPGSAQGRRLLTHELTHVVQQRGAPTSGAMVVSNPGDALEREAERTAGSL
jgi:hypothetical protein